MKNLQKLFTVVTVGATVLSLVGCSGKNETVKKEDANTADINETNQIANPWSEVGSISEAKAITGFDFTVPESIDGKSQSLVQVMNDELIEVRFGDDIIVRKSKGSDDNSGDFNSYDVTKEEDGFVLKGNGDTYNCITWTKDGYAYSITSSNGLSLDIITEAVNVIE